MVLEYPTLNFAGNLQQAVFQAHRSLAQGLANVATYYNKC